MRGIMTSIPPSPGVKWPTSCCVQEFMRESIADVLNCALSTLSDLRLPGSECEKRTSFSTKSHISQVCLQLLVLIAAIWFRVSASFFCRWGAEISLPSI